MSHHVGLLFSCRLNVIMRVFKSALLRCSASPSRHGNGMEIFIPKKKLFELIKNLIVALMYSQI